MIVIKVNQSDKVEYLASLSQGWKERRVHLPQIPHAGSTLYLLLFTFVNQSWDHFKKLQTSLKLNLKLYYDITIIA